jgi:hypothetical protein
MCDSLSPLLVHLYETKLTPLVMQLATGKLMKFQIPFWKYAYHKIVVSTASFRHLGRLSGEHIMHNA